MADYIQLQITYPTLTEARDSALFLVESKLAACTQVIDRIESCYVWQGETRVEFEALLLCKSRACLFDRIVKEITERHSYECPQIVGVPLDFVSPLYAAWLDESIVLPNC